MLDNSLLHKHIHPCPNCKKKGMGYAMHPHAYGWKDYDRFHCKYCKKYFRRKVKENKDE